MVSSNSGTQKERLFLSISISLPAKSFTFLLFRFKSTRWQCWLLWGQEPHLVMYLNYPARDGVRGRPEVVLSWVPKGCRCLLTGLQAQRDWVYEELGFAASGGPRLAAMREELPRTL